MDHRDITAVILAAGGGTRIASLTADPKVLLRLGGRSLLERHLHILAELGVRRVILVVGYRREMVVHAAAGTAAALGLDIQFVDNDDYTVKGNGYSFYLGVQHAPGPVLACDGDVVYDPAVLRRFLDAAPESAILVGRGRLDDVECAKVLVDDRGFVRMTVEKRHVTAAEQVAYRFVGECASILKFGAEERRALVRTCRDFFADEGRLLLNWEHILNCYLPHRQIPFHFDASERWTEIDTPADFQRAVALFGR